LCQTETPIQQCDAVSAAVYAPDSSAPRLGALRYLDGGSHSSRKGCPRNRQAKCWDCSMVPVMVKSLPGNGIAF